MFETTNSFVLSAGDYSIIIVIGGAVNGLIAFLIKKFFENKIKFEFDKKLTGIKGELDAMLLAIKRTQDEILQEYTFDVKKREQYTKVAELLTLADKQYVAHVDLTIDEKLKFNQLSYELTLWMPDPQIVADLKKSLAGGKNPLDVLLAIRKSLKNSNKNLTSRNIPYMDFS